jgi:acyl carrier protein
MATGKADPLRRDMENHLNAQIREFILEKFPLARKQRLKDTDALLETGILDSLGVLDLVNFIEQKFAIGMSDEDLVPENFQTIERIAAFVASKTNPTP